jgi:hypothetical protein
VVLGEYREFLVAIAGTAGSLTGLLFVAMSVAPRHPLNLGPTVIQQVRATAALLAFSNALAVSLFGLAPGNNVGYPAVVLGVIGILFTAAGARSIHSSPSTLSQRRHQLGLITLLVLIFGVEFACGIILIADPGAVVPAQVICNALAASLLTGIGRAWELVGDRRTNITSSIAVLAGHQPGPPEPARGPAAEATSSAEAGRLPMREAPARQAASTSGELTEPGPATPRTG